jgi:hypothetical protein
MNKRINFQDNIFILNTRIKMLRNLLILDTDPVLFLAKTIDDIEFINHTLETLLAQLQSNERLFERDEARDYLSDLEWEFSQFLGEFAGSPGNISAAEYPEIQEQIRELRKGSTGRCKTIDEARLSVPGRAVENAVSSAELNELLKDF